MSITTSPEERKAAEHQLEAKSDEQLREDLVYWAVAAADHQDRWAEVNNERELVSELFAEARAWHALVTVELQKRRRPREAPIG